MALLQTDRLISLGTPLGKDALLVETLEGSEGMSRLFRFQLVLVSEKPSIPLGGLVGQNVTVAIELSGGKESRYINGFVSRFAQGDVDQRVAHYYAEVVPWLWFLTRTADCRIFQRKSVPDIIQQIFKDLGFTDFKLKLQGTFEPREYCVQYRETDFNFVSRLMEEEGIFYFFEHANGKHTLVIANDPGVHQPCPNQAQARYDYLVGGKQDVDVVTRWHIEQELQPGKYTLRDYYFETPSNDLQVSTPTSFSVNGNGKFEIYDYPGYFAKRFDGDAKAGKVRPDGERTAKLGQQGEDAFHKVINGAGSCRAFTPGYSFALTEHRRAELNVPYVLTQISLSATNNLGSGEGATYDNTFTAVPLAVPFRPARTTARPVIHGTQTAVVVGTPGEEIDCDKYGRIKVQFHWDREGKKDHNSSCWIRVAQPWAGKGYGMTHVPRIGSEVIVAFLEGDPDQPIIIGSVYNAEQTPPYPLPENKMVQGIRSNTTPGGGGFNGLIVNDTKKKEMITLHAQHDMDTTVQHDDTVTIKTGKHKFTVETGTATYEVKDAVTEIFHNTQSTTVENTLDIKTNTSFIHVSSPKEIQLKVGSSTVTLTPDTITLHSANIVFEGTTKIQGSAPKIAFAADNEAAVSAPKVTVSGEKEASLSVGSQTVKCDTTQVAVSGAAIASSATGKHDITGAVVKIN